MKGTYILAIAALALGACNQPQAAKKNPWIGTKHVQLHVNDSTQLPFVLHFDAENGTTTLANGDEIIALETELNTEDSLVLNFPVYQSRLCLSSEGDKISGYFEKTDTENYFIPITTKTYEALELLKPCCALAPRYAVQFFQDDRIIPAIGEFTAVGNNLKGTFLTNAGDYRYLSGQISGNKLSFYGFDGGYVQVFLAEINNDTLIGDYYSGLTLYRNWIGIADEVTQLDDADKLTGLNPAFDSIAFAYPAIAGGELKYNPSKHKGQVVLLQITGSWCPNCKDQALFLQELINIHQQKIAVIGVAFERMGTVEKSIAAAKKAKNDLGVDYPVALAQYSGKQKATEEFPFLDAIRAYPTLIIIDKTGKVRRIHTGFSGPGTTVYNNLVAELGTYIHALVDE